MKYAMLGKWRYAAAVLTCFGVTRFSAAESVLPFADDFEAYVLGTPLMDGTNNGWYGSDTNVLVQDAEFYQGAQAAQVPLDCLLSNRFDTNVTVAASNLWMEFYVQPVHYTGTNDPECETNVASVFYLNSNGYFVLRDSDQWIVASNTIKGVPLTPVETGDWVQIDCLMDYGAKQWYFLQDGAMIKAQLGFVDPTVAMLSSMDIYNGSGPTTFLDNVTVSLSVPPGLTNTIPTNWSIPTLALSNANISITTFPGEIAVSDDFYVYRASGGNMSFTNTPQQNWLGVDVTDGVVTGDAIETVQLSVDPTGFAPGVYTGYVDVAAADDLTGATAYDSPQSVTVVMTVNPKASIAASAASFKSPPAKVSITAPILTCGTAAVITLDFTATVATL